jgi:hypothetical protein
VVFVRGAGDAVDARFSEAVRTLTPQVHS